jgi:hypothetical protein
MPKEDGKVENTTNIGSCVLCHKESECNGVDLATNVHILSPCPFSCEVKAVRPCDDKDDAHGGCCELPWYADG